MIRRNAFNSSPSRSTSACHQYASSECGPVSINAVACYRTESRLTKGGSAHPISVLELNKTQSGWGESSLALAAASRSSAAANATASADCAARACATPAKAASASVRPRATAAAAGDRAVTATVSAPAVLLASAAAARSPSSTTSASPHAFGRSCACVFVREWWMDWIGAQRTVRSVREYVFI